MTAVDNWEVFVEVTVVYDCGVTGEVTVVYYF